MNIRYLGAVLILGGCAGIGGTMIAGFKREESMLRSLQQVLTWMICELQYHLTPLPELCQLAAQQGNGALRSILSDLGQSLDGSDSPAVSDCMKRILASRDDIPSRSRRILAQLGQSLGQFDLPGQIQGLHGVQAICEEEQKVLRKDREQRLRSCQTLSLCAGAALVILFI